MSEQSNHPTLYVATDGINYCSGEGCSWGNLSEAHYFLTSQEAKKECERFRQLYLNYLNFDTKPYVLELTVFSRRLPE